MRLCDRHFPRLLLLLAGLLLLADAVPALSGHTLDVRAFGAQGDDRAKDTAAFQAALAAAGRQAGGGVVDVTPGIYLIGSVTLPAHVTLNVQAGASVLGSDDPADYPLTGGRRALIAADHADGVAITGGGLIQGGPTVGNGRDPRGPALFGPVACRGVRVTGVTLRNFGAAALHPVDCTDLTVSDAVFETRGVEADGLDADACRHVRVNDCTFREDGAGVGLESGTGMNVTHCTFLGGQGGVAVGAAASGSTQEVRVTRCIFRSVGAAVHVQGATAPGGSVQDFAADDLTVTGGEVLLVSALDTAAPVRDIHISHVKAQVKALADVAGPPGLPLDGLTLTNVTGTAARGMTIRNATHVQLSRLFLKFPKRYNGPRLTTENVQGAGLNDATPYRSR